ncbi:Hypothetical protein R9X50_00514600 [Acrodontium crateriforme]|uniref:Uncharacterized protein n=1 Tax=Acrodontium crateriforme TaxID=150365 RepID=A0AAQ3M7C2_9PEZI|nr:Hypothetical protein R9X50_00514600 [Acrodontium crateriforme]
MLSLGTLIAQIVLDRPHKIHWGPSDPVKGQVLVAFRPDPGDATSVNELFGPFILKLTFRGQTIQTFTSGNFKYREQRGLFTSLITIHDGSYRFSPRVKHKFPFTLNFPSATSQVEFDGSLHAYGQFKSEEGLPLPPTLDAWGRDLKAVAEYRLGVNGGMPGINVNFVGISSSAGPVINYDRSRIQISELPRKTHVWEEKIKIPVSKLLPATERPNFVRRRTNSLLSRDSEPAFSFDIAVTVPLDLQIGRPITYKVNLLPSTHALFGGEQPIEIKMTSPTTNIWATTQAHFKRTLIGSKSLSYHMDGFALEQSLKSHVTDLDNPFADTEYTKRVTTNALSVHPASFDTGVLCRTYTLRIEFKILVAGRKIKLEKSFGVKLHPPFTASPLAAALTPPGTSDSRVGITRRADSDTPRNYGTALPLYDENLPPGYDA